jgi:hypothetical protein
MAIFATNKKHNQFRKGAAAIYVVTFTTLLLSITTLGFIRIVLRDSLGSSERDSSQSAYDAALVGIENAKLMLLKYHRCKSEGATDDVCTKLVRAMDELQGSPDCSKFMALYFGDGFNPNVNFEIPIISSADHIDEGQYSPEELDAVGRELDQAVTCVLINDEEDEYVATLDSAEPPQSKLVPLRTENIDSVKAVRVRWFNSKAANAGLSLSSAGTSSSVKSTDTSANKDMLTNSATEGTPSPLIVQLMQARNEFKLSDFTMGNNNQTSSATVVLVPSNGGNSITGFEHSNDKTPNQPVPTQCRTGNTYYCEIMITLPDPVGYAGAGDRNAGASFLRLAIPYGSPRTDFAVNLCTSTTACGDGNIAQFIAQSKVSSIGRAGDSYRRIETRIEFADTYFPIPQYALNIDSSIEKDFWVTVNNWGGSNSGVVGTETPGGPSTPSSGGSRPAYCALLGWLFPSQCQ